MERLGERAYSIHIVAQGYDIQCKLQWSRSDGTQEPFDFSGKNMVRFIPKDGIIIGSDIGAALQTGLMQLMADETVAELMASMAPEMLEQQ